MKCAAAIALLCLCSGCLIACKEPGGVLLVPTPDGAWNSAREVAERVAEIQLLLDAPGGFAADRPVSGADLLDADGDGEPEIVFIMAVAGRKDLPWIRLEAGRDPDRPIAVRLRGLDADGRVVAYGGLEARPLFDGGDRLNVPFDLSQRAQAPFVTAISPLVTPSGASLGGLAFFASRPLDAASVQGRAHVSLSPGGELAGQWSRREDCPEGVQMWIFHPDACWPASAGTLALRLILDAGIRDLEGQELIAGDGQAGFQADLVLDATEFGACTPQVGCTALDPSDHRLDLRCDSQSGLLEPAPCSNASGGCLGARSQFGIVPGADTETCAAFRDGAVAVDGACVIMDAWPCLRQSDCRAFGAFECDFATGLCVPDPCLGTCAVAGELCVPDWGCQPGLGACLESCAAFGACAEFSQTCDRRADGLWSCR